MTADVAHPDGKPVTEAEVRSRAPSTGLLATVVLSTVALIGGTFTLGSKWGGGEETAAALALKVSALSDLVKANGERIRSVEDTKTTLAPAVARLAAATDDLSKAVTEMRIESAKQQAAQTVEIRSLHEAVSELRAKTK